MKTSENYHPISEHAKTHRMNSVTRELIFRGYAKVHEPQAPSLPFNALMAKLTRPTGKHVGGRRTADQYALEVKSRALLRAIPDNRLVEVLGDDLGATVLAARQKRRATWEEIVAGRDEHRAAQAKRNAARAH